MDFQNLYRSILVAAGDSFGSQLIWDSQNHFLHAKGNQKRWKESLFWLSLLPSNTPKNGRFQPLIGYQKSRFGDCIAHRKPNTKSVHMYHRSPHPNPTLDSYRKIDQKHQSLHPKWVIKRSANAFDFASV